MVSFINPKNKDGSLNYKIFINPSHIVKFYETRYNDIYGTYIELDAGEKPNIYSYESTKDFNERLNDILNKDAMKETLKNYLDADEAFSGYEKPELPDSEEIYRPNDIDDYDKMYEYARSYLEQDYEHDVKSFDIEYDMQHIYITNIVWAE